jgi:hypothetical protein
VRHVADYRIRDRRAAVRLQQGGHRGLRWLGGEVTLHDAAASQRRHVQHVNADDHPPPDRATCCRGRRWAGRHSGR